jgi:CPA2 family monovalent cation:H+ antiporter-2
MEPFLFEALFYLLAMVVAVPVAVRLGLGSVLGYLLAGVALGPVVGFAGAETKDLQHFAEFGVVMMLFLIGLELEPRQLWTMRSRLLGLGGLQILVTSALVTAGTMALGYSWREAVTVGLIFSLSSTAIVLQTLTEKRLVQTPGGRSSFSVLLMQDIAVLPMLALLPLLALPGARAIAEAQEGHADNIVEAWIQTLPGWGVTLVTLAAVGGIVLAGSFLVGPVYRFVHGARLREVNTAMALMLVVAVATTMLVVGLSPALGAFLVGVVLANSEFRHEIEADIEPFKGLLLGLFFITVGAGIDPALLMGEPVTLIGLTLALMAVKGAVLYGLGRVFGLKGRNQWLFTLGLAQAGEFGFVLISFVSNLRILPTALSDRLLMIVALSMLLTPLFFILYERIVKRMPSDVALRPADAIDDAQPILIAGVGRFGQVVNRMVTSSGFRTTVIDSDLRTIQLLRRFGFKGYVGDPTRPDLLDAAGLKSARVLVAAMDDPAANLRLVEYARRIRPDLHIIARAYDRETVYRLYGAGATDIVREMFDSSLRVGRYVLEAVGLSRFEANELERLFFDLDRNSVRELASVWRPGVPLDQNADYVALAHKLNRELESALMSRSAEQQQARRDVLPELPEAAGAAAADASGTADEPNLGAPAAAKPAV